LTKQTIIAIDQLSDFIVSGWSFLKI